MDDDFYACLGCGTCYKLHQIDPMHPEYCPFCIDEAPESLLQGGVSSLAKNFSYESRRAKRDRMASRRGWNPKRKSGGPMLASEAYRREGWVEGFLTYDQLIEMGH